MPTLAQIGRTQQRKKDDKPEYFSLTEYTASLPYDILQQRIDAESSLYRWVQVVLGYDRLPKTCDYRLYEPAHEPMCDDIESAMPIKGREFRGFQKKKMRLEPRGSLKTNVMAIGSCLYYLVFNYDGRELISSHNQRASKEILKAVKWNMENNETFKLFYGDWAYFAQKFGVWRDDYIELAFRTKAYREPTIDTAGAEMSKTGGHYDWVIVDDIVNRENVKSQLERDNVRERFQEYMPQLDTNGGMGVIGTRYHRSDLYAWIMKRRVEAIEKIEKGNLTREEMDEQKSWLFDITIKSAWNPDGSLYYPTRLSAKFLAAQQLELEDYLFAVWYRNQPIDDAAKVFVNPSGREREFQYFKSEIPYIELPNGERRSVYPTMSWDPKGRETTSKKSDYHGIIVNGTDSLDTWWICRALQLRMPLDDLLDTICLLILEFGIRVMSIETRGGSAQGLYVDLLRREHGPLERYGLLGLEIVEWSPGTTESKYTLITGLQPRFKRGGMWFMRGQCAPLVAQLDDFPQTEHDDCLDGLVQQRAIAKPAEPFELLNRMDEEEGNFDALEGIDGETATARSGLGTPDLRDMRGVNYGEQRSTPNERKASRPARSGTSDAPIQRSDWGRRFDAGSPTGYASAGPNPRGGRYPRSSGDDGPGR